MQKVFIYQLGKRQLRINFWLLLVFLLLQTLLNELGFWQLNRAKEKQQILTAINSPNNKVDSLQINDGDETGQFARYSGQVTFKQDFILYLENQLHEGKTGYHILQLAREQSGDRWIWVNRGWHIAVADRRQLPDVKLLSGQLEVTGRLYPLPSESIASGQQALESLTRGYRLAALDQVSDHKVEAQLGLTISPWQLRLTESDDELVRDWQWVSMQPEKHLGYAIQWFALALALLLVSFFAALKRSRIKLNKS